MAARALIIVVFLMLHFASVLSLVRFFVPRNGQSESFPAGTSRDDSTTRTNGLSDRQDHQPRSPDLPRKVSVGLAHLLGSMNMILATPMVWRCVLVRSLGPQSIVVDEFQIKVISKRPV